MKKILIVEDDKALFHALNDKLTSEGFEIIQAQNGEEGLVRALSEHPDLILLDIIMPHMDGITMLKKLREDTWGKNVHVVMLTNINDTNKISQTLELGSFEYLIKSDISLSEIVQKVKNLTQ